MRIGENFCPGVAHAVPARDGLLLRIRVPGGLIGALQLEDVATIASRFADGSIEFTSRANLQLRAVRGEDLPEIERAITSAGLLPSPQHDRVRNIVASPLAGLCPEEFLDTRPLVLELDLRLQAEILFTELHPKFSFGVHGDHRRFSHDLDDLSLEACDDGSHLRLSVAGVATNYSVTRENAVDCLVEAARCCIGLAKKLEVPLRAKRIVALSGAIHQLIDALRLMLVPCFTATRLPVYVGPFHGVVPTGRRDLVNIIPTVPLGRLSSQQASAIAEVVKKWDGDLRLAPWRGIVLGAMPATAAQGIVEGLNSIGLSCDGQGGFDGIAVCAGSSGCDASLADVRGDAVSLAQQLSGKPAPSGWTINLSGCEKQCARRHGASAELIANDSGYLLKINGETIKLNCSADYAIATIATFHNQRRSEAATV